jgi:hypothetical protein
MSGPRYINSIITAARGGGAFRTYTGSQHLDDEKNRKKQEQNNFEQEIAQRLKI